MDTATTVYLTPAQLKERTDLTDLAALTDAKVSHIIADVEALLTNGRTFDLTDANTLRILQIAVRMGTERLFIQSSERIRRMLASGLSSYRMGEESFTLDGTQGLADILDAQTLALVEGVSVEGGSRRVEVKNPFAQRTHERTPEDNVTTQEPFDRPSRHHPHHHRRAWEPEE